MKFPKQYIQLLSTVVTDVTAFFFPYNMQNNKVIILRLPLFFHF